MRTARIASLITAGALALTVALPAAAADTAMVRVLHASPDAPAVDVWVDGKKVLSDVAFKGLSDYLKVPAGALNIQVVVAGTTSPAVIDATPTFEAGKRYTVAATGFVDSIEPAVFVDNGKAVDGTSKLRVVHLSPDAPAVDVAVKGQAPADAPVQDLEFPDATGYLKLAPGSYDFEVRLADTETVVLPLDGVALAGGTNYSVFAVGSASGEAPEGQELTVVVGVDGMAAPATDTIAPQGTTGGDTTGLLALLAGAALLGLVASRRFATARASK